MAIFLNQPVASIFNCMLFLVLITQFVGLSFGQDTRVGFYSSSCPRVESIVQSTVSSHFNANPAIAPGLLRMHFHDCFVRGCDASILIAGSNTERTAPQNSLLAGFDVIDDAKTQLEAACPGVVSCADILALATRDSVVLAGGASWAVPTGRRDGRISVANEASNLPGFRDSIAVQIQKFQDKRLSVQDLVTLVGGHTIGTTACRLIRDRLYNFNSTGSADPSIDPTFLPTLQSLCPQNGDASRRVALDNGSENRFDSSFFANLRDGRGVLGTDQMLWNDDTTRPIVQSYLGIRGLAGLSFNVEFGRAMVRMGNIEVMTGTDGEIRKVCSAIN